MIDQTKPCNCWVASVPLEKSFGIRNGAHNPECPVFRPSLDPVDAVNDAKLRLREETGLRIR